MSHFSDPQSTDTLFAVSCLLKGKVCSNGLYCNWSYLVNYHMLSKQHAKKLSRPLCYLYLYVNFTLDKPSMNLCKQLAT
jgi:hypothetical protein